MRREVTAESQAVGRHDLVSIFAVFWLLCRRDGDRGESVGVWQEWKQVGQPGDSSGEVTQHGGRGGWKDLGVSQTDPRPAV